MALTLRFLLGALFQFHISFSTSNPAGLSIRAVLDDSPRSPLYNIANLTTSERIENLVKITNARISHLYSVLHPNANNLAPDNIRIPITRDDLFYAVGFTIGSRRHPVKLLLDTGGGLIWTQCQPCINCFPQRLPIYDPRDSSTYGTLPCDHPLCDSDHNLYNCVNGVCVYNVQYGGGAGTSGIASLDTFQFFFNAGTRRFRNVIFGCSNDNHNMAYANRDISGIFGLNLSPDSMASQFGPLIHDRFSYCFVPFDDAMPHPIVLRFGEDIPHLPYILTTMFLHVPQHPNFYYLELLDITVANYRIGFHPDTFEIKPDGSGGLLIDSGALFSVIDSNTIGIDAYAAVMGVFGAYYGSRRLQRVQGLLGFELCYQTPPNYNDFAAITFHFNGADYTVDGEHGHFFRQGAFCVAIARGTFGFSILGAVHQQNKRIIYDRGMGALQFANEQCINDILCSNH